MSEEDPLLEVEVEKKQSCCTAKCCFWHTDNARDGIATFAVSGWAFFMLDNALNITSLTNTGKVIIALCIGAVVAGYTIGRNIQKECTEANSSELQEVAVIPPISLV